MRIGIICEGPTDYYAIEAFFGNSLGKNGIEAKFFAIQPEVDRTQPEGGWGNVLLWLKKNPPRLRVAKYFSGGMFGGALGTEQLDCLLIQLDSDILGNASFDEYVRKNYNLIVASPTDPMARANEVRRIVSHAAMMSTMTAGDAERHVVAPAVESTETWCVAAFHPVRSNFELLGGQDLVDAFMTALERSEGKNAAAPYAKIDKSFKRRQRFCETHSGGSVRIVNACPQFDETFQKLLALGS